MINQCHIAFPNGFEMIPDHDGCFEMFSSCHLYPVHGFHLLLHEW
jgi:hypothetical protein